MSDRGSRDEVNSNYSGAESGPAIARLCYVDDSRTSAYVIRRLLQPYGYQVDYFQSAEPAFVALIQEDYDLLLTDLKVSSKGMDGDDLIRTLRKSGHPKISTLPVIVITGTTDPRILVDVYDAGANQVMNKPVDASELDGHIRRLLFDRRPDLKVVDRQRGGRDNVVPLSSAQRTAANPSQSSKDQTDQSISSKPTLLTEEVINESGIPLLEDSPNSIAMPDSSVDHSADGPQTGERNEEMPQKKNLSEDISSSEGEEKESLIERAMSKQDESLQGQTNNNTDDKIPEQDEGRGNTLSVDHDQHELESADTSIDDIDKSQTEVDLQDVANSSINLDQENNDRPEISSSASEIDSDQESYSKNTYITESENNILQEMDKHTLVIRERNNIFGETGLSSHFVSLFELIGTKGLLKRVLLAVIGLVAVLWLWNIYFDKGKPVETVAVKSGEIYQSITVPGRVVSKQRTNVSSSYAGRIIKIFVKEGDRVKTGQTLAQLDDREMVSRLNRARANLANARESVVQAERNLNRLNKAYKNGAVARQFVDDAEVDLRSARSKAGISESEVRSATLDVNKQKITAPFSGTITARYAELGQWVGPTETLFTLVDESQREIEVRVDAADSVAINVGQVVAVSSDAFPGLEWKESVTRLGTAADNKNHSNSVKVYVSLGGDAPSLRIGQQVDTDIRTAWNPNTLKVPFEALINRDGKTYVAVLNRNHVELTPVETGIEDFSMVEVKQGLTEGQIIILAKGQFLKNGEKVYPARRAK
jgi:RND family efflux transporter MFP subunit